MQSAGSTVPCSQLGFIVPVVSVTQHLPEMPEIVHEILGFTIVPLGQEGALGPIQVSQVVGGGTITGMQQR